MKIKNTICNAENLVIRKSNKIDFLNIVWYSKIKCIHTTIVFQVI